MNADEISDLLECPNCGAQLAASVGDGSRTCAFCDAVYQPAPEPPPPLAVPPPHLGSTPATVPGPTTTTTVGHQRGCGRAVGLVVVIVIAAVAIPFAVRKGPAALRSWTQPRPDGPLTIIPAAPGSPPQATPDVLAFVRPDTGATTRELARLTASRGEPQWVTNASFFSDPGLGGSSRAPMIVGPVAVVQDGDSIVAVRLTDGSTGWRATLTTGIDTCDQCVFATAGQVIVHGNDAVTHAYDAATGSEAWTRRDVGGSVRLYPFGSDVLVLDEDESSHSVVIVLDATGQEVSRSAPACGGTGGFALSFTATVVPLVPDNSVVLGYDTCWQRIDLASGQPVWSTEVATSLSASTTHVAAGDAILLAATGNDLARIDLATGDIVTLPPAVNATAVPVAVRENLGIIRLASSRGTKRYAYAAVDLTTGTKAWEISMGKGEPSDPPDAETIFLGSGDSRFTAALDGATFRILTFDDDSRDFTIDNVDVATGAEAKAATPSGISESLPDFTSGGWVGPDVVVENDGQLVMVVDAANARVTMSYP